MRGKSGALKYRRGCKEIEGNTSKIGCVNMSVKAKGLRSVQAENQASE